MKRNMQKKDAPSTQVLAALIAVLAKDFVSLADAQREGLTSFLKGVFATLMEKGFVASAPVAFADFAGLVAKLSTVAAGSLRVYNSQCERIAAAIAAGTPAVTVDLLRSKIGWNALIELCPTRSTKGRKKGSKGENKGEGAKGESVKGQVVSLTLAQAIAWAKSVAPESVLIVVGGMLQTLVDRQEVAAPIKQACVAPIEAFQKLRKSA